QDSRGKHGIVNPLLPVPADSLILNAHGKFLAVASARQSIPGLADAGGFLAARLATKAAGSRTASRIMTRRRAVPHGLVMPPRRTGGVIAPARARPRRGE